MLRRGGRARAGGGGARDHPRASRRCDRAERRCRPLTISPRSRRKRRARRQSRHSARAPADRACRAHRCGLRAIRALGRHEPGHHRHRAWCSSFATPRRSCSRSASSVRAMPPRALAERHATTVMPGRTWLQHATPITFGLKAAGWMCRARSRACSRARRARVRARAPARRRIGHARRVRRSRLGCGPRRWRAELWLTMPEFPGTRTAIASPLSPARSASRPARWGRSLATFRCSRRPRWPKRSSRPATAAAARRRCRRSEIPSGASVRARRVRARAGARRHGARGDAAGARARRSAAGRRNGRRIPALVRLTAGAARHMAAMLGGLEVDAARMCANADITRGVSLAESVSMALAEHIGKFDAH